MKEQKTKRYWVMNIRTLEEKILSAKNINEVSERLKWDKKLIRINRVWYNKSALVSILNK